MRSAKILIRLGGCPGWSEPSLGAHSFCWFCHVAAHFIAWICRQCFTWYHTSLWDISLGHIWAATWQNQQSDYYWVFAVRWQNQQSDCASSEDSDQPGHPPSLIRVFAVHMKKAWVLSYAQADLSLCWAHSHFVGFVMSRLILSPILLTNPRRC